MCNHCCSGNAISVTYSKHMSVALGIQHAMCMCHIILSSVVCLALLCFSTSSHKQHDFQKSIMEHEMFVLISSTNCV